MSESSTYSLRLHRSAKAAADKLAREEGIGMNQSIATAVAEKLAVMSTAAFIAGRKGRADLKAFSPLPNRKGGQTPRPGDERWASNPARLNVRRACACGPGGRSCGRRQSSRPDTAPARSATTLIAARPWTNWPRNVPASRPDLTRPQSRTTRAMRIC
ncbi:MAG: hypothetical protein JSS18_09665 [Proteobacteria bacterium]|nr:hypothetical protein [Pseudomonadota bacterium]